MPNMTARGIINSAYRKNAIHAPTSKDVNNGLEDLQNLLALWSTKGILVPHNTAEEFALTSGQSSYTIGSGGDFDTVRPMKIKQAFIRSGSDDYPVAITMTYDEYHNIYNKSNTGRPCRLNFDPQYPLAKINFDYTPNSAYEFHLISEKPLQQILTLDDVFSIPMEYNMAMVFNLAVVLAPDKDNQLPPEVYQFAVDSLDAILDSTASLRNTGTTHIDNFILARRW